MFSKKITIFVGLILVLSFSTKAKVYLGADTNICKGQCIRLSDLGEHNPFWVVWSTGDSTNSITICPNEKDTIWFTVGHDSASGGMSGTDTVIESDTIIISVRGLPPDPMLCQKEANVCEDSCILLQAPAGGQKYSWSPHTGLDNPYVQNPTACPEFLKSEYIITTVTDTILDCVFKDTVILWLVECEEDTLVEEDTMGTFITSEKYGRMSDIKIYPNPGKDLIYIDLDKSFNNEVITIYNAEGKMIGRIISPKDKVITPIDIHDYPKGAYHISVMTDHQKFSQKLLIY